MKKITLLFVALAIYTTVYSQGENDSKANAANEQHTLAGNTNHLGAFGGLGFKVSGYNNKSIFLSGLKGGVIINRAIAMGIEAYGIAPTTTYNDISNIGKSYMVGGYGGIFVEPVFFSNQVVHFTIPISAGAGWLGYIEDYEDDERHNNWDNDDDLIDGDVIWYIEPGITAEVNIAKWFRLGVGYSRRFTQDLDLYKTPSDAFSTNNYTVVLKFGRF